VNHIVIVPAAERVKPRDIAGIFLLTTGAILIHGYHPFVEDAEIYVPGIKKLLNPALYPSNDGFFASHAKLTLFPNLIAWSVRITHLPLEWVLLGWHFTCISLLLLACWKLGQICLGTTRAAWGRDRAVRGAWTEGAGRRALGALQAGWASERRGHVDRR